MIQWTHVTRKVDEKEKKERKPPNVRTNFIRKFLPMFTVGVSVAEYMVQAQKNIPLVDGCNLCTLALSKGKAQFNGNEEMARQMFVIELYSPKKWERK